MLNYQLLVEYLLDKAQALLNKDIEISIILKNLELQNEIVLIGNSDKSYNQIMIIYDPHDSDPYGLNNNFNPQTQYFCNMLCEVKEIGDFLLDHLDSLIINIDPEDVLEQNY